MTESLEDRFTEFIDNEGQCCQEIMDCVERVKYEYVVTQRQLAGILTELAHDLLDHDNHTHEEDDIFY